MPQSRIREESILLKIRWNKAGSLLARNGALLKLPSATLSTSPLRGSAATGPAYKQ
jgi:hypothetical protein